MQKAYMPMEVLRVTQGRNRGSHLGTYALDLGGRDTGQDKVFAPCDLRIVRVRTDGGSNGEVYAESTGPVELPDGSASVLHFTFIHDDSYNNNVRVGAVIEQGIYFYDEGGRSDGRPGVYGAHLHLEVGRGTSPARQVKNSRGCWMTPNTEPVENLLWLRPNTVVLDGGGYPWKVDNNKEADMMQFLEVFGSRNCQCFTAADVNAVDRSYNNGTLASGTYYPLMADAGIDGNGYHWVKVYAGGAVRYAVVLDDRCRITSLSAGDAVKAVQVQTPNFDTTSLEQKIKELSTKVDTLTARANVAEVQAEKANILADTYKKRIVAAKAALEI
jgi:hypothetical protein|nr:MAG TPA: Morphogenesis protein 1 hydrolase [Caudoviricetes sp.]